MDTEARNRCPETDTTRTFGVFGPRVPKPEPAPTTRGPSAGGIPPEAHRSPHRQPHSFPLPRRHLPLGTAPLFLAVLSPAARLPARATPLDSGPHHGAGCLLQTTATRSPRALARAHPARPDAPMGAGQAFPTTAARTETRSGPQAGDAAPLRRLASDARLWASASAGYTGVASPCATTEAMVRATLRDRSGGEHSARRG